MTSLRSSHSRAIVTGASGMLGGQVLRLLRAEGYDAEGWSRETERAPDGVEFRMMGAPNDAAWGWDEGSIDLVVHCAAATDADALESGEWGHRAAYAHHVNAILPGELARVARETGARFIHISTDAVYDGEKSGRRSEDEQPNPLSVYARTKLEGEGRVLSAYPDALVLRTTMFGWTLPGKRPKFAETILAGLTDRKPLRLFSDAIFSPLYTRDLAYAILMLAETDASGVLNLGSHEPVSKWGFGHQIADVFGLGSSVIERTKVEDVDLPAVRTKNVGLDVRNADWLIGRMPTVSEGIERLYADAFDGTAERLRGRRTYP